jgi:hypothetical protein
VQTRPDWDIVRADGQPEREADMAGVSGHQIER